MRVHPQIGLGVLALLLALSVGRAQETDPDEGARKQRLVLMEQTIAGFEVKSDAPLSKPALTFTAKPLLRYSDPTRGLTQDNVLLDASVWRLGEAGRPTALVTLEIYRATADKGVLSYEFASLVEPRFALRHKQNETVAWQATGAPLKMTPLEGAAKPVKTAPGRLTQMRTLARQFTVREKLMDEVIECRLLAQPIDRYAEDKLLDGAIFAFANGTNPELGLLLECSAEGWSYGAVRLSTAESTVELAGREVANFPAGDFRGKSGDYSSSQHAIDLPK